jgi:hypothetical protein
MKYAPTKRHLLLIGIFLLISQNVMTQELSKMQFWHTQRKGTNGYVRKNKPEWFQAAHKEKFDFIRLNASMIAGDNKNFLIGDLDHFEVINKNDLSVLSDILDEAQKNNLKIVLTMFELPGCSYDSESGGSDYRLWQSEKYQEQAFSFWHQLAGAVKDHPAIIAYNPLNEPHPERAFGFDEPTADFEKWLKKTHDTPADLNRFNRKMVEAIREADPSTPILIDGYFYSSPCGLPYTEKIDDPNILYAFHNPLPWQYANFEANRGRYRYPQKMPNRWDAPGTEWTKKDLAKLLKPVKVFLKKNKLASNKVIASEVLCDRRVPGCAEYFKDILAIYDNEKWHWSFYIFRADNSWTGLDYELGSAPIDESYWADVEKGIDYDILKAERRGDNPIWRTLQDEFK